MNPLWVIVVALGAALLGAALVAWNLGPRLRRSQREEDRLHREIAALRERLADMDHACRRALELCARGIEDPARSAHRAMRVRADAEGNLARGIADLERAVAQTLRTGDTVSAADIEATSRHAHQAVTEQGERVRALVVEADAVAAAADTATTAAIAMLDVIARLERGAEGLAQATDVSTQASSQMDEALHRGHGGAGDTVQISAKVAAEAERGYRAVHRTLDEIERIRDLAETARKRIDALGDRVVGIGDVVRVIGEIAEKTNLLALNASIIAAQAGEHGRSFAVVAQEIKALAQKTAASTKQISEQIHGVQEESQRATEAMAAGVAAVSEGFQVALGAGDALGEIRQSARAAQKKVQGMMRAMEEQANASKRVLEAAGQLASRAGGLSSAVRESSMHRDRLAETAQAVSETAGRLARMAREQLEVGRAAAELVERLGTESTALTRGRADLRRHVDRLHHGAAQLSGLESEVSERLAAMNEAAAQLREELARGSAS